MKRAADSAEPRITEPQPSRPAATAPWMASGAAASVMRAAATEGTSPCSAIATSVASRIRRCAGVGSLPVTRSQAWSVKVTWPTRSRHRSWPRTTIDSAFEAEMAELLTACDPIFIPRAPGRPVPVSYTEKRFDFRTC